jgi:hypothetical protein
MIWQNDIGELMIRQKVNGEGKGKMKAQASSFITGTYVLI